MDTSELKEIMDSIKIGTGMTYLCGSDRYPYVITRKTGSKIFVREVKHGPNKEKWPDMDYDIYLGHPYGPELMLSLSKRNGWSYKGMKFAFGSRYYQDPSF